MNQLTSTIVRKMIETVFANRDDTTQRQVARSVGHSTAVQKAFYQLHDEGMDALAGTSKIREAILKLKKSREERFSKAIQSL